MKPNNALGAIPGMFFFEKNNNGSQQDGNNTSGDCPCDNWTCREEWQRETRYYSRTKRSESDLPVKVKVKYLVCGINGQPKLPCEIELETLRLYYGLQGIPANKNNKNTGNNMTVQSFPALQLRGTGIRGLRDFNPSATYIMSANTLDMRANTALTAQVTTIVNGGIKGTYNVPNMGARNVYEEPGTGKIFVDVGLSYPILRELTLATSGTTDEDCPCENCTTEWREENWWLGQTAETPNSRAVEITRKIIVCDPADGEAVLNCEAELQQLKQQYGIQGMRGLGTIPGSAADKSWCSNAARLAWKRGIIKEVEIEQYYGDCLRKGTAQPVQSTQGLGMTATQWDAAQQECLKKCAHTPGCYEECMKPLGRRPINIVNNNGGGFSTNPGGYGTVNVNRLPALAGLANDNGGGTVIVPSGGTTQQPPYGIPPYVPPPDVVYTTQTPCDGAQNSWMAGVIGVGLGILATLVFSMMFGRRRA